MSSSISKRKLHDYSEDALFSVNPIRMRKDHPSSSNSSLSPRPISSRVRSSSVDSAGTVNRLQFFVRILSDHTLVLQADSSETIESIHEKIHSITGIPIKEQRLIYRGKQLQLEHTLAECQVQKDAGLHLVGRMRSTGHPLAWQLMNDVVSLVFSLYKNNPPRPPRIFVPPCKTVKSMLMRFLSMTPREDSEQASDHLQIFNSSSAPAALVMLYMSSHSPNKEAADDAIKNFVRSSKTVLPKQTHHHFVPIVLELCRLLNRAAGTHDPLYVLCRSSLGIMVEHVGVGERKELIGLRDIFPFVSELAAKLSHDLVSSLEPTSYTGPSTSEVGDFSNFLVPVKNELQENIGSCGPIRLPVDEDPSHRPMCFADEITMLHGIFVDLLSKTEQCLVKIEERVNVGLVMEHNDNDLPSGSCHYLSILKELNSVSKLYYGCKELFWDAMKRRKIAICYVIVKYANRKDDHGWILECKEITNFEARRHLAMMLLPEVKDEYDELHEMLIDRSNLLADSFEYIGQVSPESLRSGLFMEFKNEEATGPGVLREWFFVLCQTIFNPQHGFFVACPNDGRRFFPYRGAKADDSHVDFFSFCGKVIALALMHKVQVGIVFDRVFFSLLSGRNVTLEDVRDADPELYNSWKKILEMDPEVIDQDVLGLTFVHETVELGTRKIVELCPGGRSISVNSKNRRQYVDSLIHQHFVIAINEQVSHFARGFADVVSSTQLQKSFFQFLDPEDLEWILHGSESEISVDDWKAHTEYQGFEETDAQISWFWKIVGDMSADQKKVLLFFWTSIKYLPIEGFSGLASRLCIYKTIEPSDRLPSSRTCFYRLCFPAYPTIDIMRDRLGIITQEHISCSFGTG